MKFHPKTIWINFSDWMNDPFYDTSTLNKKADGIFEFIACYLFDDYFKDPKNYLYYLED